MVTFLLRVGEMGLKRAVIKRGSLRAKPGTLHLNKVLRQILCVKRRQGGSKNNSPESVLSFHHISRSLPVGCEPFGGQTTLSQVRLKSSAYQIFTL